MVFDKQRMFDKGAPRQPRQSVSRKMTGQFYFIVFLFAFLSRVTESCNPHREKCVDFVNSYAANWNAAERYCETHYDGWNIGVLAAVNTQLEEEMIRGPLQFISSDPYLGGIRIGGQFQWVDGSPFTYSNWCTAAGEPAANGSCIQVYRKDGGGCTAGQWKAVSCSLNTTFYCEYGNFNITTATTTTTTPSPTRQPSTFCGQPLGDNRCFGLVPSSYPWAVGEGHCQANFPNGDLATIKSRFELNIATSLMGLQPLPGNGDTWIGGQVVNGVLQWIDGYTGDSPFTSWCPGQGPTNASGCVEIVKNAEGSCRPGDWKIVDCNILQAILCEYTQVVSTTTALPTPPSNCSNATDCYDYLHCHGMTTSGVQTIYIDGALPFSVYCDQTTDGGGWTVFQRRLDNTEYFESRPMNDYMTGFGNVSKNYWLGLDHMHLMTKKDRLIDVRFDVFGDQNITGNCPPHFQQQCYPFAAWFGTWQGFSVASITERYRLTVGSRLDGNMSLLEDFSIYSGSLFSTNDRDNTGYGGCSVGNCPVCACGGGWWYTNYCSNYGTGRFNGNYNNGCFSWAQTPPGGDGAPQYWWRSPLTSEIKFRKRV